MNADEIKYINELEDSMKIEYPDRIINYKDWCAVADLMDDNVKRLYPYGYLTIFNSGEELHLLDSEESAKIVIDYFSNKGCIIHPEINDFSHRHVFLLCILPGFDKLPHLRNRTS